MQLRVEVRPIPLNHSLQSGEKCYFCVEICINQRILSSGQLKVRIPVSGGCNASNILLQSTDIKSINSRRGSANVRPVYKLERCSTLLSCIFTFRSLL